MTFGLICWREHLFRDMQDRQADAVQWMLCCVCVYIRGCCADVCIYVLSIDLC